MDKTKNRKIIVILLAVVAVIGALWLITHSNEADIEKYLHFSKSDIYLANEVIGTAIGTARFLDLTDSDVQLMWNFLKQLTFVSSSDYEPPEHYNAGGGLVNGSKLAFAIVTDTYAITIGLIEYDCVEVYYATLEEDTLNLYTSDEKAYDDFLEEALELWFSRG